LEGEHTLVEEEVEGMREENLEHYCRIAYQ
jgi:hypothetical protein